MAGALSVSVRFTLGCQQLSEQPGVLCDSGLVAQNMGKKPAVVGGPHQSISVEGGHGRKTKAPLRLAAKEAHVLLGV